MLKYLTRSWFFSGMLATYALAGMATVSGQPALAQTGNSCHLLTSAESIPEGFGAAYNLFSAAKELLLNVECGSSSNATLTVGNGQNTMYVYRFGYEWTGSEWKQIALGGSELVANEWYVGTAAANLSRSEAQLAADNFVVAYTCLWQNNAWKCGCRDTSCSQNYWQLQAFKQVASGGPGTSNDPGTPDVPLQPVNDVVKTVCASGCDYKDIATAMNASKPGWTIQVKNGTYPPVGQILDKDCTRSKPCALMAYPGHKPVIDGKGEGMGFYLLRSDWWIIEGLEVTRTKTKSLQTCGNHITVRNNYIHDNRGQNGSGGYHPGCSQAHNPDGTSDTLFENNRVAREGVGDCSFPANPDRNYDGGPVPWYCHAIYVAAASTPCAPKRNITIRRNILEEQGGAAIQLRADGCSGKNGIYNVLIENNIMRNNVSGMNIDEGLNITVRNNSFIVTGWPKTDAIGGVSGNRIRMISMCCGNQQYKFVNNIFYTTRSEVWPLSIGQRVNASEIEFENNVWHVASNNWQWLDKKRTDFRSAFKSVTGYEKNGKCCEVDPRFISSTNFKLQASSPARNGGNNSTCSGSDYSGTARPQEGTCDAGAYEHRP